MTRGLMCVLMVGVLAGGVWAEGTPETIFYLNFEGATPGQAPASYIAGESDVLPLGTKISVPNSHAISPGAIEVSDGPEGGYMLRLEVGRKPTYFQQMYTVQTTAFSTANEWTVEVLFKADEIELPFGPAPGNPCNTQGLQNIIGFWAHGTHHFTWDMRLNPSGYGARLEIATESGNAASEGLRSDQPLSDDLSDDTWHHAMFSVKPVFNADTGDYTAELRGWVDGTPMVDKQNTNSNVRTVDMSAYSSAQLGEFAISGRWMGQSEASQQPPSPINVSPYPDLRGLEGAIDAIAITTGKAISYAERVLGTGGHGPYTVTDLSTMEVAGLNGGFEGWTGQTPDDWSFTKDPLSSAVFGKANGSGLGQQPHGGINAASMTWIAGGRPDEAQRNHELHRDDNLIEVEYLHTYRFSFWLQNARSVNNYRDQEDFFEFRLKMYDRDQRFLGYWPPTYDSKNAWSPRVKDRYIQFDTEYSWPGNFIPPSTCAYISPTFNLYYIPPAGQSVSMDDFKLYNLGPIVDPSSVGYGSLEHYE